MDGLTVRYKHKVREFVDGPSRRVLASLAYAPEFVYAKQQCAWWGGAGCTYQTRVKCAWNHVPETD